MVNSITLPAFLPSTMSPSAAFWLRAQSVKKQTNQVVKSPFLISRTLCMARKREAQSIQWEGEADEKKEKEQRLDAGQNGRHPEESSPSAEKSAHSSANDKTGATDQRNGIAKAISTNKAPQTALMGLSMLGSKSRRLLARASKTAQLISLRAGQILTVSTDTRATTASICAGECRPSLWRLLSKRAPCSRPSSVIQLDDRLSPTSRSAAPLRIHLRGRSE